MYDASNLMHVNFCVRCGRAYRYGSGPDPGVVLPPPLGAKVGSARRGTIAEKHPVEEPSGDAARAKSNASKKATVDGNVDDPKRKTVEKDTVPFAKQCDIQAVGACFFYRTYTCNRECIEK